MVFRVYVYCFPSMRVPSFPNLLPFPHTPPGTPDCDPFKPKAILNYHEFSRVKNHTIQWIRPSTNGYDVCKRILEYMTLNEYKHYSSARVWVYSVNKYFAVCFLHGN
jgi:hypothetical protein